MIEMNLKINKLSVCVESFLIFYKINFFLNLNILNKICIIANHNLYNHKSDTISDFVNNH